MPTVDCGHWNGRRNRLPHLAGSIVWRFRLPVEADFHRHPNPENGYALLPNPQRSCELPLPTPALPQTAFPTPPPVAASSPRTDPHPRRSPATRHSAPHPLSLRGRNAAPLPRPPVPSACVRPSRNRISPLRSRKPPVPPRFFARNQSAHKICTMQSVAPRTAPSHRSRVRP